MYFPADIPRKLCPVKRPLMGITVDFYHRVVSPGEYSEAVLVLIELLLDLRPHAFGLTLQHDKDGLLT